MAEDAALLVFLQTHDEISDSYDFAASLGVTHTDLENLIKSLKGFEIVNAKEITRDNWVLTKKGKSYVVNGSPEVQFFLATPPEGISKAALRVESVKDDIKDLLRRIDNGEFLLLWLRLFTFFCMYYYMERDRQRRGRSKASVVGRRERDEEVHGAHRNGDPPIEAPLRSSSPPFYHSPRHSATASAAAAATFMASPPPMRPTPRREEVRGSD
uniref:PheRS DNA binding domain-containing protein n=1 Tax=Ananas comosus var. bracteatus TaxID=296719 RepID=A0A6V7QHG6_ANACO|nr:unnamed protein product [Ananas comosus var. bracteatus]